MTADRLQCGAMAAQRRAKPDLSYNSGNMVSSLAHARSSYRANRDRRTRPTSGIRHMGGTSAARHPRRDTKTLFPLHPLKSVLVSRPLAGLFSILHARAIFSPALRSELQTDRPSIRRRIRAAKFL